MDTLQMPEAPATPTAAIVATETTRTAAIVTTETTPTAAIVTTEEREASTKPMVPSLNAAFLHELVGALQLSYASYN